MVPFCVSAETPTMPASTKPSIFDTAEVNTDAGSGVIDTWLCTWPGEGAAWTAAGASAVTTAVSAVATIAAVHLGPTSGFHVS
jgi:hypothetical protein